jgi:hypothetical protein
MIMSFLAVNPCFLTSFDVAGVEGGTGAERQR